MKYFIIKIFFSKIIQVIKGRICLLLVVSIIFILFMFFDLFHTLEKSSISIEIYHEHISKSRSAQNPREPIIFSKSKYLNQIRKVKIFPLSHCLLYTVVLQF
jgi:capsular polysaccharide biosynthesis protein